MLHKTCLLILTVVLVPVLVGCAENKLTRHNYDMIKEGMSTKLEVENTLGKPMADRGDSWQYEDEDEHLMVFIHWNDAGKVEKKEWINAKEGVWEGTAPGINERPEGRPVSEQKSNTTIKKE
ncbi:MAG TPA: hypothetical protein VMV94_06450 [Phycisphaerae bacterium]|nr:hypothetical protein [Phycisphaerae bacterium]